MRYFAVGQLAVFKARAKRFPGTGPKDQWQSPGEAGKQSYLTSDVRSDLTAMPPASDFLAFGDSQPVVLPGCRGTPTNGPGATLCSRSGYQEPPRAGRHGHSAASRVVPETLRKFAYWDEPLPIGYGQTISQPFIVAFMTEQLNPKPTDRILEIGTESVPGRYSFAACS